MKRSTIVEIISALFILLFVYTAASKLLAIPKFQLTLGKSPLIGTYAPLIAIALPIIELVVAVLLLIPTIRRKGFYAASVLMVVFTLYLSYMLIFTPKLPCSCGGVIKYMSWSQHLLFNIFFTALAFLGIRLTRNVNEKKINEPKVNLA